MTSTVDDLLRQYRADDLSLAQALCDRHPPDAPAFRIVDADLGEMTLTYAATARRRPSGWRPRSLTSASGPATASPR